MGRPTSAGPTIMEMIPTITAIATSARSASTIATGHSRFFPAAAATRRRPRAARRAGRSRGRPIDRPRPATQLSANWEPAVDAESGIKGYRYAIGTTPGGTDVAAWTPLANVLGVTRTGLNLTMGQTCYFSVKAVNGVGLVGRAATCQGAEGGDRHDPAQRPGGSPGRRNVSDLGNRLRYHPFDHGVGVQLRPGHRRRERNQRLRVCHRHDTGRNGYREVDGRACQQCILDVRPRKS